MFKNVDEIITILQFQLGLKQAHKLAKRLDRNESYFRAMRKDRPEELKALLEEEYKNEIQQFVRRWANAEASLTQSDHGDPATLSTIHANQKELLKAVRRIEEKLSATVAESKGKKASREVKAKIRTGKSGGTGS